MYEKKKKGVTPTESLTFLENQLAFGFNVKQVDSSSHEVTLAGYKKIFFRLFISDVSESPARHFTIRLGDDYFDFTGIYVHESVGFFTSGVDGISIIYSDKGGSLQAKYLANNET